MKKTIKYLLSGAITASVLALGSCSSDDKALPPIDGYNNSNEVGSANLVAHWSFDDNNNELMSSTAPSKTYGTVASTDGVIGKGLKMSKGAIKYPSISSIGGANSLSNYTVSMWVKVSNNADAKRANGTFSTFFGIYPTAATDFWGNINLSAETGWFSAAGGEGDTLVLKTNYTSLNADGSNNNQDNRPDPRGKPSVGLFKSAGQWCHYVVRFTASTHMLEIYGNANSIGAYSKRNDVTTELKMRVPCQVVFGSLANKAVEFDAAPEMPDWQKLADAEIDDVRVFNTSLADKDITALYNLGLAGR
jgi:hypothetical protein